jgi:tetratricopeptide (TPR) repeat protein
MVDMDGEQTADELIERGLAALDLAEFDDAIESFGDAAVGSPDNPRAWFYLGLCYLEVREAELAIEALNRAIAVNPNYADAHYLLGTAAGAMGRLDEASQSYRRALQIDPDHQKADEFLVRTEALLASREHYREAMRLIYSDVRGPESLDRAVRELLHSVAIFNESPARNEFSRLAATVLDSPARMFAPSDSDGASRLWASAARRAQQALNRRNWAEAATCYHEAMDLSPDQPFIHHALGAVYLVSGDVDAGIRCWQRAFDLDPDYNFSTVEYLAE